MLHKQKSGFTRLSFARQKFGGFTLIEVLAAILVLTIGLVSVLSLVSYNIKQGSQTMNQIIAFNLAQEGIEIVRNIRDTNIKQGNDYDLNIANGNVDYDSGGVVDDIDELYLISDKYVHDAGAPTPFKRHIEIDSSAGDHLKVESIVEWGTKIFTLTDFLYDLK